MQGIAVQPDGRIVAAGLAGWGFLSSNVSFALARYDTDGTLDTTFSGDGKLRTQFTSSFDAAWGVALQADGKIVPAGQAAGKGGKFALARYNTDGSLDPSFGGGGKVLTNFTGRLDMTRGVAIQADGKIVLSGVSGSEGANPRFALARYLPT